ncbi:MAG TPA: hypothetical protein VKU80_00420 [Planctomycetota bacterium]|nr:hypothetical protein [Planctomycetota bacterium]
MKGKGGSLYEVLKSASRTPGGDPGAPSAPETTPVSDGNQATLQERLAAYKAAKLAEARNVTSESRPEPLAATPKVSATTLVLEPDPTPVPAATVTRMANPVPVAADPAPVEEDSSVDLPAGPGPGEGVLKLTYNTALFGGMIAVGLLFIAYAIGLHVGKTAAPAPVMAEVPRPVLPAPAPVQPPRSAPAPILAPPHRDYTIRLCELKIATAQDRLKALAFAEDADLKKALERSGHKGFERANIKVNGEPRMALYVDKFSDINSEPAKAALTAMKNFRFKNQTPFAAAVFEELQPR